MGEPRQRSPVAVFAGVQGDVIGYKVEFRDLNKEPPTEEESRELRAEVMRDIGSMDNPTMDDVPRLICRALIRWWLLTMKVTPCEN